MDTILPDNRDTFRPPDEPTALPARPLVFGLAVVVGLLAVLAAFFLLRDGAEEPSEIRDSAQAPTRSVVVAPPADPEELAGRAAEAMVEIVATIRDPATQATELQAIAARGALGDCQVVVFEAVGVPPMTPSAELDGRTQLLQDIESQGLVSAHAEQRIAYDVVVDGERVETVHAVVGLDCSSSGVAG